MTNLKKSKSKEENTKFTGHRGEKYHAFRSVFTCCPSTAVPNPNPSKYWRRKVLVGSYGLENIYISRIASYNDKKGHFFTEITFWKGIAGILKALAGTGLSSTAIVGILGSQGRWQVVYQSLCTIPFLGLKVDMF
jgi:hypothetical protein